MINRGVNFESYPLNIVGSSIFGRYPKISIEKTTNFFQSDTFMVPYPGYQTAIPSTALGNNTVGRGVFSSIQFNRIYAVLGSGFFQININYDHNSEQVISSQALQLGALQTSVGVVYIAENNKPEIGISDNQNFYLWDPINGFRTAGVTPGFEPLGFTPGYLTFHDTYFIMPDRRVTTGNPRGQNIWRLSVSNDGTIWPDDKQHVGLLQTKPDNVQAVVRFPSKGNMILVMGSTVTESWFDTGAQLFPYQRNNQYNIDYGCLNPATVAYMDEVVVWLGSNEKSGPIIMYSNGGMPKKITTDGIDYQFANMKNPADSEAFIYRQDGHLIYHINFYTDNLSLFYDFNTDKFYHACDENQNYYIASDVAFFNNQYYFITPNNGNFYALDTAITTYDGAEIPRSRICANVRLPSQEYRIINDIGFTIESGETNYQQQNLGAIQLITQNKNTLISQDGKIFITQQMANTGTSNLSLPHVDLSISTDGGATFGSEWAYYLSPIGHRKNKLMWWQGGISNDFVAQFRFWSLGRAVITDGEVNVRK